jgi:FkbM family methyltransferase
MSTSTANPPQRRTAAQLLRRLQWRAAMATKLRTLQLLRRLKGDTVWTRRGGHWLPFHGDGDLQEVQYQLEGDLWFRYESERLAPFLPRDGVVVDVGANLGFTTLVFAKHVGPGGRIFAFEPSSLTYPKLVAVVAKNGLSNVECLNLGCGTAKSTETLLVPATSGNATIRRSGIEQHEPCREVRIEIDTLDNVVLPQVAKLDLIKIDTEGFEDQVLAGGEQLVSRHRPVIYIELSQEYGASSARAISWLRERGYTFDRDPDLAAAHNGDNFLAFPG